MRSNPRSAKVTSLGTVVLAACAAALWLGCDSELDQVRSYEVKKQTKAVATAGVMQWDLPQGWRVEPNRSAMRFATLSAGAGDDAIEIAITKLGGAAGGVGPNINRWRTQLGLEPISDADAAASATEIKARETSGWMVDLTGPRDEQEEWEPSRMLAAIFPAKDSLWFVKTTATASTIEAHRSAFVALCESVRFGGAPQVQQRPAPRAGEATQEREVPKWGDLPDGWRLDAQSKPMSVASLSVSNGSQQASLTITPLGGSQDLLDNINRWRRQVGLGPISGLDEQPPTPIEVAGQPGHLVDAAGAEKHILGVISTRGAMTWFYKLTGPDPLVAEQKAAFESFIRSMEF